VATTLVFGATGAVGGFLLPLLGACGDEVLAASRQPAQNLSVAAHAPARVSWLRADLFAPVPALPALRVIYSLGPLDAFAAWFERSVATLAGSGNLARVVALSSMSAQSKADSIDPIERDVSARLRDAEMRLFAATQANAVDCTIFRPTLIYGSGRDRSLAPIARFARRWRVLPVPRGADGMRQPVHAADLAAACIAVRAAAATFGKTYALGGGERLRFDAMLQRIAAGPPRIAWPVPVPAMLVRAFAHHRFAGALSRLRLPLIADNGLAQHDFGYAPRAFAASDVLG
jgi:nucleoside-diphosphate-sugar epimerase